MSEMLASILKWFRMEDAHPPSTPLNLHTKEIDGKALDNNNNGIELYQAIPRQITYYFTAKAPMGD